jgi:hypothetical protein
LALISNCFSLIISIFLNEYLLDAVTTLLTLDDKTGFKLPFLSFICRLMNHQVHWLW